MTGAAAKITDFALLQVGWFVCVLGGAAGNGWIGPTVAVLILAVHVGFVTPRAGRRAEVSNIVLFGLFGAAVDTLQTLLGVLCFDGRSAELLGLPLWMSALWFLFPILFNTTLDWLRFRVVLPIFFGLIGGPLAYLGGESLEALRFGSNRAAALASVSFVWALYTPVAMRLARR